MTGNARNSSEGRTMKNTGRFYAAGTVAVALSLGFLGCGGGSNTPVNAPAAGNASPAGISSAPVEQKALDRFNSAARRLQRARQSQRLERRGVRRDREVSSRRLRRRSRAASSRKPRTTPGSPISAAETTRRRRRTSKKRWPTTQVPLRARSARALSVQTDSNDDAAIGALEQAVIDAKFQNVPALVNLAMFQMQRDSEAVGANCHAKRAARMWNCRTSTARRRTFSARSPSTTGTCRRSISSPSTTSAARRRRRAPGQEVRADHRHERGPRQARRRAAARARCARVLAGRSQEPRLCADSQHLRTHSQRARSGQHGGERVLRPRPSSIRSSSKRR